MMWHDDYENMNKLVTAEEKARLAATLSIASIPSVINNFNRFESLVCGISIRPKKERNFGFSAHHLSVFPVDLKERR